jgi:hypothetical protein
VVELFHSMPMRGSSPYNLTMLRSYFIHHEVKNSPTGTDEEEGSHGDDSGEDMEEA